MTYFVVQRGWHGKDIVSLCQDAPQGKTKESRRDITVIKLSEKGAQFNLSQLRDLWCGGHLEGDLVIPISPVTKRLNEKAAPSYRDPRPPIRTFAEKCTCGSDKADVVRKKHVPR